jgi:hypothetical protein
VNRRTVLSIANLVAIVVAFFVLFELPQYYEYAFYGLLGWLLAGFVLFYAFRPSRSTPLAGAASPSGGPSGTAGTSPLPSGSSSGPSAPLDFCIFCGNTLPIGMAVCPACGHQVVST